MNDFYVEAKKKKGVTHKASCHANTTLDEASGLPAM